MNATSYFMALRHLHMTGAECARLFGYTRQSHYLFWQHRGPPQCVAMFLRLMIKTGMTKKEVITYTKW